MKGNARNCSAAAGRSKRPRWALIVMLAILAAAASVRAVFLVQLSRSDLGEILPLDMRFYHDLGSAIVSGGGLPHGGLTFNPLYPFFLACVFKVFGAGLLAPRIIQALAGLLTLWLIFLSARMLASGIDSDGGTGKSRAKGRGRVSGDVAGVTAAALALLYPQLLLYEGSLLATSLVTLIMAASFFTALALCRALRGEGDIRVTGRRVPPAAAAVFLGILSGAGVMGRPNIFLLLAPLLAGWLFAAAGKGWKRLKLPLYFAAGLIVMTAPASIYNASRTGSIVPLSAHGGINLYIGNMRGARGLYDPPEGMRRDMRGLIEDSRIAAERAGGSKMTDSEVSAFWSARARERIVSDPGGWLVLLGRKFLLFWNGGEMGDIVDIGLMRKECPVFRLLFMRFSLISALAFTGAFLAIWSSPGRWPLAIFLASSMAAVILFYFNTRYRLPSIPVLTASAGYFTAWTAGRISARMWKSAAAGAAATVLFFAFVSGREMFEVNRSATYTFLGNHYMSSGDGDRALKAFEEAMRLDPESVENMINLARALSRAGQKERAAGYYRLAWESAPDFPRLALEYGYLLEELGMRSEARTLYDQAWRSGRRNEMITACKLLSRMAYSEGRVDEAIMWVRRALELAPGDEDLLGLLQRLEGP